MTVISKIPVSTAASSSSSPRAMRELHLSYTGIRSVHKGTIALIVDGFYSLKPIDIVVLKKLSDVVNVVPVIAKSDSLTLEERLASKERIKEEFAFHNLKMYPYEYDELDDEERSLNVQIKVCASTTNGCVFIHQVSNERVYRTSSLLPLSVARRTLWSTASRSVVVRTAGVSSTSRTRTTVNLSTCGTS